MYRDLQPEDPPKTGEALVFFCLSGSFKGAIRLLQGFDKGSIGFRV